MLYLHMKKKGVPGLALRQGGQLAVRSHGRAGWHRWTGVEAECRSASIRHQDPGMQHRGPRVGRRGQGIPANFSPLPIFATRAAALKILSHVPLSSNFDSRHFIPRLSDGLGCGPHGPARPTAPCEFHDRHKLLRVHCGKCMNRNFI